MVATMFGCRLIPKGVGRFFLSYQCCCDRCNLICKAHCVPILINLLRCANLFSNFALWIQLTTQNLAGFGIFIPRR